MEIDITESLSDIKLKDDTDDAQIENLNKRVPKTISFGRRGRDKTTRARGMQTYYAPPPKPQKKTQS